MFKELAASLATSAIYDFGKSVLTDLSKNEIVQLTIRKIGVIKTLSDFPDRYVETLVELRLLNKDKSILEFFRDEEIMKLFYDYFYAPENSGLRNNEAEFNARLAHFIKARRIGDEINEKQIDIASAVSGFKELFNQKVHENRNMSDVVFYNIIRELLNKSIQIEVILQELRTRNIENIVTPTGETLFNINTITQNAFLQIVQQAQTRIPKQLTDEIPTLALEEIVGRAKELEEVHRLLCDKKQVVVVNGLGGIGKTTLAQVYVHRYWEEYHHIAWVAQTSNDILLDFTNAPGLLKSFFIDTEQSDPKEIFSALMRKMKTIDEKPNLLILDNADSCLENYHDILPKSPQWHILVTSRHELEGFTLKQLDFLDEEDALQLFKKYYTRTDFSDNEIKALLNSIDYHTLTIEILAKTAHLQHYTIDKLTGALAADAKAHVKVKRAGNQKIETITSYLCSIFELSGLTDDEKWLLKQFVCLPAEFHSYKLLIELISPEASGKEEIFAETITNLSQKGWLQRNDNTDSYKMHRIINEVVKKQLTVSFEEISPLMENITEKLNIDQTKDNPVDKFQWIPFGDSLLLIIENAQDKTEEFENVISILQNNLALVLQDLGEYERAKELLEKAVNSDEKNFDPDHPSTAIRYSNLAIVLKELGEYERAKELLEKAVKSDEKNFGSDHPSTARSYSNLATVLQTLGDYERAKEFLEKAVKSDEKNFGPDHPSTTIRYSNLALVLQDLGEYNRAKELLEKAVKSDEKNFGTDHPSTATSYSNLAIVLKDLGDYERAKELFEKVMKSAEKNYGADHPSTARSYSNLATVLRTLGEYGRAKELLEKALKSYEKNFGADHPSTAISYSNLALVLLNLDEYERAKELLEKAVKSDEKNFGVDHPSTAISYSNLAIVLQDLGKFERAKELLEKAYGICLKRLGSEHPNTKIVKENLDSLKGK